LTTRIGAVLAVAVVVVAAGLLAVLSDSKSRQSGSNHVPEVGPVLTLRGTDTHCQPGQVVPKDTGGVRLLVGTFGREVPGLAVTVRDGGRTVTAGRYAGGPEGHVIVPLRRVSRRVENTTVCIRVQPAQRQSRTVLYGASEQVRLEWQRPGDESWLGLLPTVAHRFGFGRGVLDGSWVLALAALALAGAWVLALRLTLRELSG
jgi:hypothetical protein